MLAVAIIVITAALVFYTIGVWSERVQRTLRWWHVVFFALGLTADATGTFLMTRISTERRSDGITSGTLNTLMAWTGTIALALMAIHLAWAIIVLLRNKDHEKAVFHRFSIGVWCIWLVPYIAGAAAAMGS